MSHSLGPGQLPGIHHGKAWCQQVSPKQREGVVEESRVGMLTVIQPEDNASAQEGSQSLSQGVHRQLDPGLSREEAHRKGHGRVQVGPWAEGDGIY